MFVEVKSSIFSLFHFVPFGSLCRLFNIVWVLTVNDILRAMDRVTRHLQGEHRFKENHNMRAWFIRYGFQPGHTASSYSASHLLRSQQRYHNPDGLTDHSSIWGLERDLRSNGTSCPHGVREVGPETSGSQFLPNCRFMFTENVHQIWSKVRILTVAYKNVPQSKFSSKHVRRCKKPANPFPTHLILSSANFLEKTILLVTWK